MLGSTVSHFTLKLSQYLYLLMTWALEQVQLHYPPSKQRDSRRTYGGNLFLPTSTSSKTIKYWFERINFFFYNFFFFYIRIWNQFYKQTLKLEIRWTYNISLHHFTFVRVFLFYKFCKSILKMMMTYKISDLLFIIEYQNKISLHK